MYCVDITPRYCRLRIVNDSAHHYDCSWEVHDLHYNGTVLIGVSFFEKEYEQIDYIKIKGFLDALCNDLKRFQSKGIIISNYCDNGEYGNPSAHIWIDFKKCYRELKSIF